MNSIYSEEGKAGALSLVDVQQLVYAGSVASTELPRKHIGPHMRNRVSSHTTARNTELLQLKHQQRKVYEFGRL